MPDVDVEAVLGFTLLGAALGALPENLCEDCEGCRLCEDEAVLQARSEVDDGL